MGKLPHPAFRHNRVIPSIHLPNLPNLVVGDGSAVHREIPSQRDGMVVSQCQLFTALVFQVEDEFRIFAVLVCEDVLSFEYGCIEAGCAEGGEYLFDDAFNVVAAECLCWAVVSRALGNGSVLR